MSGYEDFKKPVLKTVLCALAAIGMVEVAFDGYDEFSTGPFDSLSYARLTESGAYIFNLTDSFAEPEAAAVAVTEYHLDDRSLVLLCSGTESPQEMLLQDIMIPIGGRRYRMNAGSFMKNCRTSKDVSQKIKTFYSDFCKEPLPSGKSFSTLCPPEAKMALKARMQTLSSGK